VAGQNLTHWDAIEKAGHDMKDIVATLARSFLVQIAEGMVLSNISPGNLRIAEGNRLVILDRYFYLHLKREDQALFSGLTGANRPTIIKHLATYLGSLPENRRHQNIEAVLASVPVTGEIDRDLMRMITAAKDKGLAIPLRMTLLFHDALTLNNMAKRAGFTSLLEALTYTPGN
jgi:predicted unusual protein kinase regulating ubiquinone biosynthesis (AarF/ABC1/UbiB family)